MRILSLCRLQERGSAIGKLEPISPVSPVHMDPDLDLVPARFSKEELIQNMDRVDREITMVEQQICKLRKKQVGFILIHFFPFNTTIDCCFVGSAAAGTVV